MITGKCTRLKPGVGVDTRQAARRHSIDWLLLLILPGLLLTASGSSAGQQAEDPELAIQHLISYVRESDVLFERNISRHDSIEAAAHIEKKYRHFRDEIDTPKEFIRRCATTSLVTGKQYLIITGQGDEVPAAEWLNAELVRYRLQNVQQ